MKTMGKNNKIIASTTRAIVKIRIGKFYLEIGKVFKEARTTKQILKLFENL